MTPVSPPSPPDVVRRFPSLTPWALALGALLLLTGGVPSWADEDHPSREAVRQAVEAGAVAPLEDLLARVASQFEGRVLKVELEWEDHVPGNWVYEVKLLSPDGRVLKLEYQARTLDLLRTRDRHERGRGRGRDD